MKLTYPGPHEAVILATGQQVERGKSVDVKDEAIAASLLDQGWTLVEAVPAKKAAKPTTAAPAIPKE